MTYQDRQRALVHELREATQEGRFPAELVPISASFADKRRCLTTVVYPPTELRQTVLQDVVTPLQSTDPEHTYYEPSSLHITVKNVRVVNDPPHFGPAEIQKVAALYEQLIPTLPAFEYALEGLIRFPTSVAVVGYTDERLQQVVTALDEGLRSIDVADDKRYASTTVSFGNMTICRFSQDPTTQLEAFVSAHETAPLGVFPVRELVLLSCDAVMSSSSIQVHGRYKLAD